MTFPQLLKKTGNDYDLAVEIFTALHGEAFAKDWPFAQWVEVIKLASKNSSNFYYAIARKELIRRAKTYKEWIETLSLTFYHCPKDEEENKERDKILDEMYSSISDFDDCMDFLKTVGSLGVGFSTPSHPIHKFRLGVLEKAEKFASTFQ